MPASTRFILLRPGAAAAKPSERNTAASPPAKAHTVVPSVPEETNKMANAAPTLAPDDTPMISGLASGLRKTVWYTKPTTPRPNPPASAITGQAQHRKGAHCHSVPRQQCLQGYGITAEIKCRTKGHKNAERCAQKAQRRAFAVIIHKIQG